MLSVRLSAVSVVLPLKVGVCLFVVVPPGELSIVIEAIAEATGAAASSAIARTIAPTRRLHTLIALPPPRAATHLGLDFRATLAASHSAPPTLPPLRMISPIDPK